MLSSVRPPRGTGHSLGLTVSPGLAVPGSKAFSQACPRTKSGPVSGTCVWPLNPAGSDLIGETRGGAWGAPGERVKDSLCLRFKHQSSDQRAVGPGLPPLRAVSAQSSGLSPTSLPGRLREMHLVSVGSEVTGLLHATQERLFPWDAFHLCQHLKPQDTASGRGAPAVILPLRTEMGRRRAPVPGGPALCPHSAGPALGHQHQDFRDTVQPRIIANCSLETKAVSPHSCAPGQRLPHPGTGCYGSSGLSLLGLPGRGLPL